MAVNYIELHKGGISDMALIKCPDCGKEVSDKAQACIHCGCPIASNDVVVEAKNGYQVVLVSVGGNKIAVIKEIRELHSIMGFDEAVQLVDSAPCCIKKYVSRSVAEQIQKKFQAVGADVQIQPSGAEYKSLAPQNDKPDVLYCPRCHSTAVTTGQRGFSFVTVFLEAIRR